MAPDTPSPDLGPIGTNSSGDVLLKDHFRAKIPTLPTAAMFLGSQPLKSPHFGLESPVSLNGFFGEHDPFQGLRVRPRNTSECSTDIEPLSDGQLQSDAQTNNSLRPTMKKRPSADGVDYPRRRATIACEICRSRKSRCDGSRPKCRLCTELNAKCVYREPGIKLDAGDKLILERLDRIESLLKSDPPTSGGFLGMSLHASSGPDPISDELLPHGFDNISNTSSLPAGLLANCSSPIFGMPPPMKATPASALHFVTYPTIRELIGRPCDPATFLHHEMTRKPLKMGSFPSLDLANTAAYVQAFFERVNVWYACMNPYKWTTYYRIAMSQGFRDGPESCIVLLVLALGNAGASGSISRHALYKDPPGFSYFAAAWAILPTLMTRHDIISAQCLFLAGTYLIYLARPIDAWNLLNSASMKLQLLMKSHDPAASLDKELAARLYWNLVLIERDLHTELGLPSSGVAQYEETMALPGGFEEDGNEPAGRDELWYFLAEVALSRLVDRANYLVNASSTLASLSSLDALVAELDYQLSQWYEGLPLPIQFPLSRVPLSNPIQTVLRLRYFACRTAVFRPYVLAVLNDETLAMDPSVQDACRKCLEACIRQIEHVTAHHAGHLPYLWQGSLSVVSQTLIVMGATMSPSLAALLPPPEQVEMIIKEVIGEVESCAPLAPSLQHAAEVIREAEERRQVFIQSTGFKV